MHNQLGQFDWNRLTTLGKDGCYTARGYATNQGQVSNVVIKPLSEINNARVQINTLYTGVDAKVNAIDKLSRSCQSNFQKYIDTPIPVCGAGVTGWLAKAVGTGGYQECLAAVDKAKEPVMEGNRQFAEMGNRIRDLNADYSELLQYSPSVDDWQKLCAAKLRLDTRHKELKDSSLKLVEKALEKMKKENALQEKADNEFNRFEQMLNLFLEALKALLEMLRSVFESFLKGLTKLTAFISDHPWVLWVGGSVVGLGVLGFVLRPYLSVPLAILGRMVGKKSRKRN